MPDFEPPNYAIIEGTEAAFAGFYPRVDRRDPPAGALDIDVPVADGVTVGCRIYGGDPAWPSILYFHGNGETVSDYDDISRMFIHIGINFFVAGYRGYGHSTGEPTFPSMLSDSNLVLATFEELLDTHGFFTPRFVMGRSMGAHSAVELAAHHPNSLRGLILSSGVARPGRAIDYLRMKGMTDDADKLERQHLAKVQAIRLPTLVIHGDHDELVSYESAERFFDTLTMDWKHFETIAGAGHNDILSIAWKQYADAIQSFVREHSK